MDGGLGVVFHVAGEDTEAAAYGGLGLLSQVCVDEGMPFAPLPLRTLTGSGAGYGILHRVGLRPAVNEQRQAIAVLTSTTGQSNVSLYLYYCKEYKVKPNSKLRSALPSNTDEFSLTSLDLTGNLVGDRGLLPVLEVVRMNHGIEALLLPDNGLSNLGAECLVHMALDHPGLTSVDLRNNRLTIGGATVLLELAKRNSRMRAIDLTGTKIDEPLLQKIRNQLEANAAVRTR